ncbi:c-type cytochrome [Thioalbus denitrificans]|uniref:Cytochrome c n=1 Tax=Thioalbus denitrificans TaxID=547122 RepID=A0A369CDY1_9GAMM|nr:c-type cytochrome [Thioalbus denitrificans]RCX31771.1 cytochrome c [Thioalbus denitrificans]
MYPNNCTLAYGDSKMSHTHGGVAPNLLASLWRFAAVLLALASVPGSAIAAEEPAPRFVNTIAALHETVGGPVLASILPATPVVIRSQQGTHIEVEVTGWSPMGGASYLFKDIGQRISRAVLTEEGVNKRAVIGTREDAWESTWEDAKITGWIEQGEVVEDIDTIWEEASTLYFTRCSRCHSLRRPREFTANQWPSVLKIMTVRAGFSREQAALVTALLQYHGRDQKGEDFFTRTAETAAPTPAPPAIPKIAGSPELAAQGGALFASANCFACHGQDAKTPIMPVYPKLAGQNAEYLFKQILDFKGGTRANDSFSMMKESVLPLSEDDARAISYWLSLQ